MLQVRAYAIKLPDVRMICVVKISTAGGLYGVGESGLSFRELAVKGVSQTGLVCTQACMSCAADWRSASMAAGCRQLSTSSSSLSGKTPEIYQPCGSRCTAPNTLRVVGFLLRQ